MKKVFALCIGVLLFTSCERDTIVPEIEEINVDQSTFARKGNKVDVCHKGKIINVSVNAVSAHQGHGDAVDLDGDGYFDLENDCSPIDCDDTNSDVNLEAEEICDNGIDDNCDGLTDGEDPACDITPNIGDCSDGGVVFYVAGENEDLNGDGIADQGLIVALEEQGPAPWNNNGTSFEIGVDNYDIGFGFTNTEAIIDAQGPVETDYAAGLARSYEGSGYTDWFLPSGGEMFELYNAIGTVNPAIIECGGIVIDGIYWTSTEEGDDDATDTNFANGDQTTAHKGVPWNVRAVRVF